MSSGAEPSPPDPRRAIKRDDGFVATFVSAPLANLLLRRIAGSSVTPNQVTMLSVAVTLLAAAAFAAGDRASLVAGAILLQLAFVLDCLDGQLARHREQTSELGAWLDLMTDRLGDVVVLGALALGCARRSGDLAPVVWGNLAILVVFYRHFDGLVLGQVLKDFAHRPGWATAERRDEDKVRWIEESRARRAGTWGAGARLLDRLAPNATGERRPALYWMKRALLLDGGERYLLVGVLAAAGRPEWALVAIVAWGGVVYPLVTWRRWTLFASGTGR